jgi:asparagine synthase (glutamine-hydrolysing)
MCGIVGFLTPQGFQFEKATMVVQSMSNRLHNRGPDESGEWIDPSVGIALGHRRLSVLDLSKEGNQPMVSASGRYVISYNGEIYNHINLRKYLEPQRITWRGTSDTETLLTAIDEWGLERAVKKCIGMFAFAVWDRYTCSLSLVRDRIGEKPLFYGWQGGTFLFASELKALEVHPDFEFELFRPAIDVYLHLNYVPAPWSIWTKIKKIEPGSILSIIKQDEYQRASVRQYWSMTEIIKRTDVQYQTSISDNEAIDGLEEVLNDSVRQQSIADVRVGAFLSGGIDSSLIVALMQEHNNKSVETFSIGFDSPKYDEAPFAKAVAKHLGTNHNEMYVSAEESLMIIPYLPKMYDEPFGDSSQIPTCLVAKLARKHVTVALTGDGGDELFAGYSRYSHVSRILSLLFKIPDPIRKAVSLSMRSVLSGIPHRNEKLLKLMHVLASDQAISMYRQFVKRSHRNFSLESRGILTFFERPELWPEFDNLIESMMFADMMTYLPDDLLTKVDRATMAVSLEARAPFLDHRVVEFAWQLPMHMRMRDGNTKWLIRRVLDRYIPRILVDRPKRGFSVPIASWLRKELEPWAEELISRKRLLNDGLLDSHAVQLTWNEHQSGRKDQSAVLWNILMLQSWLDEVSRRRSESRNE